MSYVVDNFKDRAFILLEQLEELVNEMPFKGNSEESQKVCLGNAIHKLTAIVNGVEDIDFSIELGNFRAIPNDDEGDYDIVEIMVDDEGEEYEESITWCMGCDVEKTLKECVEYQNSVMAEGNEDETN